MGEAKQRGSKRTRGGNAKPFKMKVIEETEIAGRAVFRPDFVGPAMKGGGNFNAACGTCGTVLLENVGRDSVSNMVIRCAKCGSYNLAPPPSNAH